MHKTRRAVLSMLLVMGAVLHAQEKIWKQTSDADFLQGTFTHVGIASGTSGEVRLIHPILQAGADTLDPSLQMGMVYDESGNAVRAWITSRIVYVQKFDAQRRPLSDVIRVNPDENAHDVKAALLDDGRFVVCWANSGDVVGSAYNAPRYCQFFTEACSKVGGPIRVFSPSNGTAGAARPVADNGRKRFLLLSFEQRQSSWYQTYGMFYSADGRKLSDSIPIIPTQTPIRELQMTGAYRNGRFAFAWTKTDDGTHPDDIYYAFADTNLTLITPIVRVNESIQGGSPDVKIDRAGNALVSWMWMAGHIPGPPSVLYGRAFDSLGRSLGPNVPLTHFQSGNSYWYGLNYVRGNFRLEYGQGFNNGQPELPWTSTWNILAVNAGTFTSAVFDAGLAQTAYRRIFWEAGVPAATRLTFQVRGASSYNALAAAPWLGPASASDRYTLASGEALNPLLNGNRFIQLQAFFEADSNGQSPILKSVSVSYASADSFPPLPVTNARATGEHRRITVEWGKSPSADVRSYRIYRALAASAFDPESFALMPAQATAYFDSTAAYDSLYRYGITAIDSAFNESPIIELSPLSPKTMRIFVSQSGSMPEEGTSLHPCWTIGRAINLSTRGDTILVMPGEYREEIQLKTGIALIGSGAANTKIVSPNAIGITTAPSNLVKGFTIVAARGIAVEGSDLTVTENIFMPPDGVSAVGIYLKSSDRVVVCKNIFLNLQVGMNVNNYPTVPKVPGIVRNNIFYGCIVGGQNSVGTATYINNTFVVVGSGRLGLSTDMWPTTVMNNCFAGYPAPGTYMTGVQLGYLKMTTIEYNSLWNFNSFQRDTLPPSNIKADPMFANLGKKDFHLGGASLCRDAGNPAPEFRDRDGSRNDLGAYGGPDPMPESMTLGLVTDCTIGNATGFPGDTVTVDVTLSNPAGVKQADFEVMFDDAVVSFHSARVGALPQGFTLEA
ncbi:MAG TPA: DUF1565 domain-containing protein, partial [Bacteroidota bacterium]|nr:DUF1565 domain-containing protein [Bacteroidota bacterium]